jgi:cystathionine beta-lyase/cystathionine gamma-synthase
VIAKTKELAEQIGWVGQLSRVTGSAFDSFLTLRGLRTLHVRCVSTAATRRPSPSTWQSRRM